MSAATESEVRQETRLVLRLVAGTGAATVVAVPFLFLMALVLSQSRSLARVDQAVASALNQWALHRPGVVTVLEIGERVSSPWSFRLMVLFAAALLWRAGSHRLATWAVTTMALGGVLNLVLKETVGRARPSFVEPVATADSFSFPSGHAQNSALGVGILLLIALPLLSRRRKATAWAVAALVVFLTGFDRISLGVHFISDVVAGWVAAAAVLVGTAVAFGVHRHRGHAVVEGVDAAESRRLSLHVHGPGRTHPGGVPELLTELRGRLGRLVVAVAIIWAVLAALGLLVTALDEAVWPLTVEQRWMEELVESRTPTLTQITGWMSWIADTVRIQVSLVLVAVILRLALGRWRESVFVVATVCVQALAFVMTTAVVARPRPDVPHLDPAPPTSSFPSGHTGAALALYLAIGIVIAWRTRRSWLRVLVMAIAFVPPACVAYARLYRGMHFPSDLIGSVVCAALSLAFAGRTLLVAKLPPQLHDVLDRPRSSQEAGTRDRG